MHNRNKEYGVNKWKNYVRLICSVNKKEVERVKMKIYDKKIYELNKCIEAVIIVIICFTIGYVCGILAGDKSEELKNKDIEIESLKDTVYMLRKEREEV